MLTNRATSFIGAVVEPIDAERSTLAGGCFALFGRCWFVTADHVLEAARERGHERLHVLGPGLDPVPVAETWRHPMMDVAVMYAPHDGSIEAFAAVGPATVGQAVQLTSV